MARDQFPDPHACFRSRPPRCIGRACHHQVREGIGVAATGRAFGSRHVPLGLIGLRCDPAAEDFLPGLACYTPVALYCAAGDRCQRAGEILCSLGYSEVYNISGFSDWRAAGGAVEC